MVALQILVLPVQVRILVRQPNGYFRKSCKFIICGFFISTGIVQLANTAEKN